MDWIYERLFSSTTIFFIRVFCSLQLVSCLLQWLWPSARVYLGHDVESGSGLMMMMTDDAFIVSSYSFVQMGYFFFSSPVVFGLGDSVYILLRAF